MKYIDIQKRIKAFPDAELDRLLQGLSDVLSTLDIGEAEAWDLLSEIEAIAIKESQSRSAGWIPEEIQAGGGHCVNDYAS